MPDQKQPPVTTPLHLLRDLSESLIAHLEKACAEALTDAEKLLAKLEKQRVKVQDKLHKNRDKLQEAAQAGKAKAQAKARQAAEELEEALDTLKARQSETRDFIARLKRDSAEALKLAQGIGKVKEAAAKALGARDSAAALDAEPVESSKTTAKPVAPQSRPKATRRVKPAAKAETAPAEPENSATTKETAKRAPKAAAASKPAARKAPSRARTAKPADKAPTAVEPLSAS